MGLLYIVTRRAARGIAECEHALALDRNLAHAHAAIGCGKAFTNRGEETEAHVVEALRLSPRGTMAYLWFFYAGFANNFLDRWEQAVPWFRRSIEANRNYPLVYFALGYALGRLDEARSSVLNGLALNPAYTIARARATWAEVSDDPAFLARLESNFELQRMLGVPES